MRVKDFPYFGCASCGTDFYKGLGNQNFADLAMLKLFRIRAVSISFMDCNSLYLTYIAFNLLFNASLFTEFLNIVLAWMLV